MRMWVLASLNVSYWLIANSNLKFLWRIADTFSDQRCKCRPTHTLKGIP